MICAGLDRGDDLVGHAQYGVVAEAGQDLLARVLGQGRAFQGLVDYRGEIPAVDVLDAGPCHQAPGEEAVGVGLGRALDAVGVEDDRAGEVGELLGLILPGAAEVAHQVAVFLQAGIAVGRQHLAVGVDVDPLAFGLLEELFQHLQVVAGDQDGLAGLGAELHRGRYRVAVGIGVGGIQKAHDGQVLLAALHGQPDKIHQAQVGIGGGGQRLLEKSHDFVIAPAEDHGVIHIGRHTLQAVHKDLDDGTDVFIDVLGIDAVLLALG